MDVGSQPGRGIDVVRMLWARFQQRDWKEARALFHEDATLLWPVSRERIDGATGIIRVNEIYPEGWTITPQSFGMMADGRILSVIRVDHPPESFFAVSIFTLSDDRIHRVEEYWSTMEDPPSWRTPENVPGHSRTA